MFLILFTLFFYFSCAEQIVLNAQDSENEKMNAFIENLISQMTVEEMASQLDMFQGELFLNRGNLRSEKELKAYFGNASVPGTLHDFYADVQVTNTLQKFAQSSRLGIPILVIEECLHGLLFENRTNFPQAIALASTFNPAMVEKVGRAIATEARASGVHFCLSPVLDLSRDPRWGRVEENYGECPFLTSQMAVAMVKGLQNDGNIHEKTSVVAEIKHFSAHGSPAGGRNTAPVKDGLREVLSSYMVPFREAVMEAGAKGIMAAYNEVDGIPNVSNRYFLTDLLRESWGFEGIVVSDLAAIAMLITSHYTASNSADAIKQFHKAGGNIQFYDFDHDQYSLAISQNIQEDPR